MELEIEILCKEYKHKKTVDEKLIVDKELEEYYIVPLTRKPNISSNGYYHISLKNQLLWLKYSNGSNEILLKDCGFDDYLIIRADDIIDIYMYVSTSEYFRKNVWSSQHNVRLNNEYMDKYLLCIPIIDGMINVKEFGEGIVKEYQIHLLSNEVLLKKTIPQEHNCNFIVTSNFLLNKEALFIPLFDGDVVSFMG